MSSPLLQLTLTIDEASIGKLLQAALMLHARIDALGLIEAVPYTKNVPAALKKLPLRGRPRKDPPDEAVIRRRRAREAFVAAVAAAGSEGLERETGRKIYGDAGGNPTGFGGVARNFAIEKRNRLFPLPTPRGE